MPHRSMSRRRGTNRCLESIAMSSVCPAFAHTRSRGGRDSNADCRVQNQEPAQHRFPSVDTHPLDGPIEPITRCCQLGGQTRIWTGPKSLR
jgi:hypothetical protein